MKDLISPIEFIKSELISINLLVDPSLLSGGRADIDEVENQIEVERRSGVSRDDKGMLVCDCVLYAKVQIGKDEGTPEPLVKFSCMMRALSRSPELAEDEKLSEQVLEANTISFIWGKIRNWMELLAADSIIEKKVSLPALDPYSLVDDEEDGTEAEEE